jgi:hypothetical protein
LGLPVEGKNGSNSTMCKSAGGSVPLIETDSGLVQAVGKLINGHPRTASFAGLENTICTAT